MTREEYTTHELAALRTSPYRTQRAIVQCSEHCLEEDLRSAIGTLLAYYWKSRSAKVLVNGLVYDVPANLLTRLGGDD